LEGPNKTVWFLEVHCSIQPTATSTYYGW
jgi:hypothetical protein